MSALVFPLLILSGLASYISGSGLQVLWPAQAPQAYVYLMTQVVSAALHAGWILSAGYRRALPIVVVS